MINVIALQTTLKVLFGQTGASHLRSHLPFGLALLILTAVVAILAPVARAEQKIQVSPDPELAAVVNMSIVQSQSTQPNTISFAKSFSIKSLVDARAYALELVNRDRMAHGLAPLVSNPFLDQVAQTYAEDMLKRNYFDHLSPEGETVVDRCIKAGGNPKIGVGENLMFYHNPNISGLAAERLKMFQTSWMNSQLHRINILNTEIVGFGFGIAIGNDGREYAVQLFSLGE